MEITAWAMLPSPLAMFTAPSRYLIGSVELRFHSTIYQIGFLRFADFGGYRHGLRR